MLQAIKHVCLILTLLAWVVFPLPECYLTKPNCTKRNSDYCQVFNHQRASEAAAADLPVCAACPHQGQPATAAHPNSGQGEGSLLRASLSPKFLLQDAPAVTNPLHSTISILPAPAVIPAAARSWSPARGGLPDPIPILQRTQTLLI